MPRSTNSDTNNSDPDIEGMTKEERDKLKATAFVPRKSLPRSPQGPGPLIDLEAELRVESSSSSNLQTVVNPPLAPLTSTPLASTNKTAAALVLAINNIETPKTQVTQNPPEPKCQKNKPESSSSEPSSDEEDEEEEEEGEDTDMANVTQLQNQTKSSMDKLSSLLETVYKSKKILSAPKKKEIEAELKQLCSVINFTAIKYAKLKGAYAEQDKIIQRLLAQKAQDTQTIVDKVKDTVEAEFKKQQKDVQQTIQKSYAETAKAHAKQNENVVQSHAHSHAHASQPVNQQQSIPKIEQTKVLIVHPKEENEGQTSEETRARVHEVLKPMINRLKISKFFKIRNGGVVLEVHKDQVSEIGKCLEKALVVREPTKKRPKVRIFDVPTDQTDSQVIEAIRRQNFQDVDPETFKGKFKLVMKIGPRNKETVQWIVEVDPEIRKSIMSSGKIYLDFRACKATDYIITTRCFRCQLYGHLAKDCAARTDVCSHCAQEGHTFKDCTDKKKQPQCANCARRKFRSNHSVTSDACPSYQAERTRTIAQTDYGR